MAAQRSVSVGPGGVYDLGYHLAWCSKYRRPVLEDGPEGAVATRCEELLQEKAAEHGWEFIALEVKPDHIHAFIKTQPKDSPAFIANQLKGFTSRKLREEFPHLTRRLPTLWSRSFFVATAGAVTSAKVQQYIETQWERPWRKEPTRLPEGGAVS